MARIAPLVFLLLLLAPAQAATLSPQEDVQSSVIRVTAHMSGGLSHGSAVVVAPGKAITSCHVLRKAVEIKLSTAGQSWPAQLAAQDVERDLCILDFSADLSLPAARLAPSRQLSTGQRVFAAGYPGGKRFKISEGEVKALHEYQGAHVIQTSAYFEPGASGGGLFDAQGRLVGILTFKAVAGGDYHFVLPAEWLSKLMADTAPPAAALLPGRAFWEKDSGEQPYFLRAAILEQNKDWAGLLQLARKWSDYEAPPAQAWLAMHKACERLGCQQEALSASQRAARMEAAYKSPVAVVKPPPEPKAP